MFLERAFLSAYKYKDFLEIGVLFLLPAWKVEMRPRDAAAIL